MKKINELSKEEIQVLFSDQNKSIFVLTEKIRHRRHSNITYKCLIFALKEKGIDTNEKELKFMLEGL